MRFVAYVLGAAVAASVLVSSSAARADVIPISIGARVGYAKFLNSDSDVGYLPFQADAMYSVGFGLRLGLYGSYGPAVSKPDGLDSASLLRAGIQAHFRLPLPLVHPWVGAGTGYERASGSGSSLGLKSEVTSSGWERFNLQAGLQFTLLPVLELGPYVQYENGKFSSGTVKIDGKEVSGDSSIKATDDGHGRINVGLRAELSF